MQDNRTYKMNGSTYIGEPPKGFLPKENKSEQIREARETAEEKHEVANVREQNKRKDSIKYDAAYISYISSGESAAVFITRDVASAVPTSGKWIDVINSDGYKRRDNRWIFKNFTVEIFPRKIRPQYPEHISDEDKKYITWKTAHKDIEAQRRSGVRGDIFIICPRLVKNGKKWEYEIVDVEKI